MRASLIRHTFLLFQSLSTTSLMVCVPGVVADLEVHNIVTRYLTLIRKGRFMTLITVLFPSFARTNGLLLVHSPHVNPGGKRMIMMASNRIILILMKTLLSSIISSKGILWNAAEVVIIAPWQRIIIPTDVSEANEAKVLLYWNFTPHLPGLERVVPPDITHIHQLCLRMPLLVIMPLWYHSLLPYCRVVLLQWKTYLIMGEKRRRKSGVVFVGSRVIGKKEWNRAWVIELFPSFKFFSCRHPSLTQTIEILTWEYMNMYLSIYLSSTTLWPGSLALTVSKLRESFIISLVIKLQCMHKSISLIQQSSSMSGGPTTITWIL